MPEPQEDDKTGRMRSRILSMNKEAARFFHACLNSTVEEARQARAYWRRRGLDDKTIARFGLGYAPDDGQALYLYLRDKGYNQQELDASGLFKRSQSGRIYCLFWKRVMTPIFDLRGNIIAFGGRTNVTGVPASAWAFKYSLPVLRLSHSPRFSMAASKLMASPMSEPSANETMSMVVPVVASAFPSMMSVTRFPVVRLRPTQPSFHIRLCTAAPHYNT